LKIGACAGSYLPGAKDNANQPALLALAEAHPGGPYSSAFRKLITSSISSSSSQGGASFRPRELQYRCPASFTMLSARVLRFVDFPFPRKAGPRRVPWPREPWRFGQPFSWYMYWPAIGEPPVWLRIWLSAMPCVSHACLQDAEFLGREAELTSREFLLGQ